MVEKLLLGPPGCGKTYRLVEIVKEELCWSLDPLPPFAQGREKAKYVLDNNAELYNEIDSKIKLALKKVQDMNHSSPSNNHDNENDETKSEVL